MYFANESADHITAPYSAKVVVYTKKEQFEIDLEKVQKPVNPGDRDGALFIHTSPLGIINLQRDPALHVNEGSCLVSHRLPPPTLYSDS